MCENGRGHGVSFRTTLQFCCGKKQAGNPAKTLTLVGAVRVGLVAVVPAVVVPVAGPVVWDAAAAITLKLSA